MTLAPVLRSHPHASFRTASPGQGGNRSSSRQEGQSRRVPGAAGISLAQMMEPASPSSLPASPGPPEPGLLTAGASGAHNDKQNSKPAALLLPALGTPAPSPSCPLASHPSSAGPSQCVTEGEPLCRALKALWISPFCWDICGCHGIKSSVSYPLL